jgi:hypothetical protein
MHTAGVYGFASEDLEAARVLIESALSIRLQVAECDNTGRYFRGDVPSGPSVQIRRNIDHSSRPRTDSARQDTLPPWHPDYGALLFIHGPAQEMIEESLRAVPGLIFLERRPTM